MDEETVGYYNRNAETYVKETIDRDVEDIRRTFASYLTRGARILDLGSGSCRDTIAFRKMGFDVVPTDVSEEMRRIALRDFGIVVENHGFDDILCLGRFDGVWACSSLLHAEKKHLPMILHDIRSVLSVEGVFYCSFKRGTFEGWRDSRWYTDLEANELASLLENAGFDMIDTFQSTDVRGVEWLNSISRRR